MKHVPGSLFGFLIITFVFSLALTPTETQASTLSSATIKNMVQKYFKDAPEMVSVAECESGFRQYDESGAVLRGGYEGSMVGLFQVHETVHRDAAHAMGYDIDSLIGNLLYARYLYREEGVNPWIGCVGNDTHIARANTAQETSSAIEQPAPQPAGVTYAPADSEENMRNAVYAYLQKMLREKKSGQRS